MRSIFLCLIVVALSSRLFAENPFVGKWKIDEAKSHFTGTLDSVKAAGTVSVPNDGTHYSLKFDGKDYPEEGPRIPDGVTVSAQLISPCKVMVTTKFNGKIFDHEDWEMSADGKTFTYTQRNVGVPKAVVVVLHRME